MHFRLIWNFQNDNINTTPNFSIQSVLQLIKIYHTGEIFTANILFWRSQIKNFGGFKTTKNFISLKWYPHNSKILVIGINGLTYQYMELKEHLLKQSVIMNIKEEAVRADNSQNSK